jgi:DNA-binding response OmpR family regulator
MAKILIVDDDSSLLQMVSIILKRAGHESILSTEAEEGYNLALSDHPDLIIIDVMMPQVNGYQLCSALRKNADTKNLPVLILTALTETEHRERAEDAGADGFVTKPITSSELVLAINEALEKHPQ